jgi:ABC-type transport system involved in cytochrome c biogenesis permease subunit
MNKKLSFLLLGIALVSVAFTLLPPRNRTDFDLAAFSQLPTLANGRFKPLDTIARSTLLMTQGRQRVKSPDGRTLAPAEWLLDMLYRSEVANHYAVFEIVHPDVLALLNLTTDDGIAKKRFSFEQIRPGLRELDRQAKLADDVEAPVRTPFQRAAIQLRNNLAAYQRLQHSLMPAGDTAYLDQLLALEKTPPAELVTAFATSGQHGAAGQSHGSPAAKLILEVSQSFTIVETWGSLHPIPPETASDDPAAWKNAGTALQAGLTTGRFNPAALTYARLGTAWREQNSIAFNAAVTAYRDSLAANFPAQLQKCVAETRFNSSQPFYTSTALYVVAFLLAIFSWLKWPDTLQRTAFGITALAFVLTTAGIATRMWLEGRPPVTNLYSSALFVGWGAVGLCLILERIFKNAIGSAAAGLIGFATLLIAHHLSLGGDTLEMMRAVLDSNFWLATHVVMITIGYAATFLAGALALIYVFRGVLTRSLDQPTADALNRMVYGIVCFATLFSFVGTVLGGIWADQSWGRFWGWDPKENGALIIVLWNALILHARWGGLIKQRGLMALAIFGNVVTAWSWFGVNMLGVGLHSYGFMDSAFWWLIAFALSQLAAMALTGLPLEKWRSFQTAPATRSRH